MDEVEPASLAPLQVARPSIAAKFTACMHAVPCVGVGDGFLVEESVPLKLRNANTQSNERRQANTPL